MITNMIYLGNNMPKNYDPSIMGDDPELSQDQPMSPTETAITVSPDSTLSQSVAEIKTIWAIHSHDDAPSYISCSDDMKLLATFVAAEFGGIPFRELTQ